ncbi:hypothetical protein [Halobellus salinisoli]|uniref:hypothetical protein n=1 Tax=Halobellus salinisoli TaxID=3108500 RepID=UPI0031F3277C
MRENANRFDRPRGAIPARLDTAAGDDGDRRESHSEIQMGDERSTDSTDTNEPSDTMRRRGEESRVKLWLLLEANRWIVAGLVVAVFFLGIIAVATVVPNRVLIAVDDPVETLFQALVTATITGVTLVVSINSLVLSQELGALGDQRERMEGAMSFRRDVEDVIGPDIAPATPANFLRELIAAVETRARALSAVGDTAAEDVPSEAAPTGDDADAVEQVREYAEDLQRHASSVESELEGREFGTFGVLSAALNFNYSWKIYEARRLRTLFDEGSSTDGESSISEEPSTDGPESSITEVESSIAAALDDVILVLTLFGPTREHIKTLYFQWELVNLSRAMLYSAVPALVVATNVLLFHGVLQAVSGWTLGIAHYVWIVAATASLALAPFAILLSFVLRIGTIAKRTLSIGPLILRTTDASDADER